MSDANTTHYGVHVERLDLTIECGSHSFQRDGRQEGPCICPVCGRRFVLTWSVNVEPAPADYEGIPPRQKLPPGPPNLIRKTGFGQRS